MTELAHGLPLGSKDEEAPDMKLIDLARRRPDGLIDPLWVEGFDAFRSHSSSEACPYPAHTEEFHSWIEGWMDADRAGGLEEPETSR